MRIRKERQEANIRISEAEVAVSRAITQVCKDQPDLTHLELIQALQNVQNGWINIAGREETPAVEQG